MKKIMFMFVLLFYTRVVINTQLREGRSNRILRFEDRKIRNRLLFESKQSGLVHLKKDQMVINSLNSNKKFKKIKPVPRRVYQNRWIRLI